MIIIWYDGKWVYKYTIWMGFGWRWEENIYEYHYYVILLFIICIGLEQVSCQSLYHFWIALSYHINTPLYFAYLFFAGLQLKILDSINEWLRSINFSFILIICTFITHHTLPFAKIPLMEKSTVLVQRNTYIVLLSIHVKYWLCPNEW